MNDSIENGKLVAEFVAKNISIILDIGRSSFTGAKAELTLRLKTAYTNYLQRTAKRYGQAKSFFVRSIPTNIYDFYVPLGVTAGDIKLGKVTLSSVESLTTRAVVAAPAGAGKSMLLRHFFLNAIQTSDRVPIFVELRSLHNENKTIIDAINENLRTFGFDLGDTYVQKAMKLGHFIILLDGFDEVVSESRRNVSNQIVVLAEQARDCIIIVSSRPDDTFSGWEDFTEFTIAPLNVDEACELVEKLPFDEDLKKKFLADLRNFLFDRHESFLSNPLLLSIMLLTYGESADIPKKLGLFYNQAYEALFQRHDALKGGYQRDRLTSLDIQDFARIFAAFCLQTYDNRSFQFSRSDALKYISKAKTYVSINVKEEDYLRDCLQSVCLLMEDGLNVVFSHRSFQEYFVARYINSAYPRVQRQLLDRFIRLIRIDGVYSLLYEINPALVERELLVPKLEHIFDNLKVKRRIGITHFLRFMKENFSYFRFHGENIIFTHRSNTKEQFSVVNIIAFTYDRCVVPEHRGFSPQRYNAFIKKHATDSDKTHELDDLSIKSPIIKDLAENSGLFSIHGLEQVFQVSRNLARKHARVPESLEALLK